MAELIYWHNPKTGAVWSDVDVRFHCKDTTGWTRIVLPPPAGAQQAVAMQTTDKAVFAIVYDDHELPPEIVVGRAAAEARFERISASWNAHLFGKLKSNSRDDAHASNNIALAAPAAAEDGPCDWSFAGWFQNSGAADQPHWEQVSQDYANDEGVIPLGFRATPAPEAAPSAKEGEADMRAICEALGFDPTNHHNALKCPYCNPQHLTFDARKGLTPAGGDRG